jgi:hypothetical protein
LEEEGAKDTMTGDVAGGAGTEERSSGHALHIIGMYRLDYINIPDI